VTTLNERAGRLADAMARDADELRIAVGRVGGARVIDCGVKALGGLRAGLGLARVCLADLGEMTVAPGGPWPLVQVLSDDPLRACMASQYAGWQVAVGKYFAMGSGPMRALYGKEKLFDDIGCRESAPVAVGVLEGKLPDEAAVAYLCEKLQRPPEALTLLAARTASLAGTLQVVARSLEMALHKLHELGFDLKQVVSGTGTAPLPPPAKDDLGAIGRTNDAILYGGRAVVWVDADDGQLAEVGPKVPSNSSPEHGALFGELFQRAGGDFYKIDPNLFSPAQIVLGNRRSGRAFVFGKMDPEALRRSFGA
jgi:methenyltetrahydromethanopterin cyclohydrolase